VPDSEVIDMEGLARQNSYVGSDKGGKLEISPAIGSVELMTPSSPEKH
jgi:hypothetical protein